MIIYTIGVILQKSNDMEDSLGVCAWWAYMDDVLYAIHDYDYPQSTSDYPYCKVLECDTSELGYCTTVGL